MRRDFQDFVRIDREFSLHERPEPARPAALGIGDRDADGFRAQIQRHHSVIALQQMGDIGEDGQGRHGLSLARIATEVQLGVSIPRR